MESERLRRETWQYPAQGQARTDWRIKVIVYARIERVCFLCLLRSDQISVLLISCTTVKSTSRTRCPACVALSLVFVRASPPTFPLVLIRLKCFSILLHCVCCSLLCPACSAKIAGSRLQVQWVLLCRQIRFWYGMLYCDCGARVFLLCSIAFSPLRYSSHRETVAFPIPLPPPFCSSLHSSLVGLRRHQLGDAGHRNYIGLHRGGEIQHEAAVGPGGAAVSRGRRVCCSSSLGAVFPQMAAFSTFIFGAGTPDFFM